MSDSDVPPTDDEKSAANAGAVTDGEEPQAEDQGETRLTADEEIDAALADSSAKKKQKKGRKKKIKYAGIGGVVLFLSYLVYWGFSPYTGSNAYGICKVFLELTLRYPTTLQVSTVQELGSSVRIWHTQTDSFGEYRLEPVQCYFKKDEKLGFILEKVTIRRREVDQQLVEDFNRSLPAIFSHMPDLTLPAPLPDSLKDLQIETFRFRKPIL